MKASMTDSWVAEAIRDIMVEQGLTLSTAESCTSGRIAASLTCVSGASEYFQAGLVAYQNEVKTDFLGVPEKVIEKYDVVSEPVVKLMVKGACKMFGTDCALASTGYAGGGNDDIPQGTIWLGWGTPDDIHTMVLTEDMGREENTKNAAMTVISNFLDYLNERYGGGGNFDFNKALRMQ